VPWGSAPVGLFLVWKRGVLLFECPTDAILYSRIDEQTDGHHHQQGHDAFGLFEIERGGEKLGGFEEAKPALRMGLAFIAGSQFLGGNRVSSRSLVARMTQRGWSTRGGRAAMEEASPPAIV